MKRSFIRSALAVSIAAFALLALLASGARAEVKLCEIFGDSMVLQRDLAIPVWGEANAGESVSVTLGDVEQHTVAGADGRWMVHFDARAAGGPFELVAKASNEVRVRDVMIGEVWVCAGQSNMGWPLALSDDGPREVKGASASKIRFFQVGEADAKERAYHLTGVWKTCDPNSVGGLSGVAWFFGRSLENTLGVTIGLVQVTANGTPAEPWTDRKAMAADPELKPAIMRFARKEKSLPGARFNGMIGPLAPFAIRGVAWYQGESNCAEAFTYRKLLPTLIDSWRALWGQGDFWFLLVQLPGYGPKLKQPGESEWAELREAQMLATKRSKIAMCVTLDTGDVKELHPTDKRDVGERLALVAKNQVYGQSVESSGPTFKNFSLTGREFVINFEHATGLHTRGGGKVLGFSVAGADRKWSWGEARIDGTKIVVKALNIETPVAVRYAWADDPDVNLINAAGLPMAPFRTDDWPMITIPRDQPDKPDKPDKPDGKKKR